MNVGRLEVVKRGRSFAAIVLRQRAPSGAVDSAIPRQRVNAVRHFVCVVKVSLRFGVERG
jgi:hypothetical protein